MFAITLLIATGSLIAFSAGDPESMALLAFAGITIVLLGFTAIRLSEQLKNNGIPIVE